MKIECPGCGRELDDDFVLNQHKRDEVSDYWYCPNCLAMFDEVTSSRMELIETYRALKKRLHELQIAEIRRKHITLDKFLEAKK